MQLSLSLSGEQGAHTLFTVQREGEREREIIIFIFKRNDGCLGNF
jgi:hypothetical protein